MTTLNWTQIKNFKKEEWKKDPSKTHPTLILTLDQIREKTKEILPPLGAPIIIHVAWDNSGHSPNSYHYKGMAVDFHFKQNTLTYLEQLTLLLSFNQLGAIGFYPTWNNPGWHIDIRTKNPKILWSRINNKYHYGIKGILKGINLLLKKGE